LNPQTCDATHAGSATAARTAAQYREYLIDVLHLRAGTPPPDASYLQALAFTQV